MTIHEQFVQYGKNAKEWTRKCVILLPEINRQRIWEKKGFSSIYEYAAKLAGMSKKTVDEALRVMEKVKDKPALKSVIERRGLWAVRPAVNVATKNTESYWAEKAETMSHRTLRTFIREQRHVSLLDSVQKPVKIILVMDLSPKMANKLEKLKDKNWEETIARLLEARQKNLLKKKPPSVKTDSRAIPRAIEKFIMERSNKTCEFPLCKKPHEALHHADRFALVHEHNPDRIFALCAEHHDLAHQSLIDREEQDIEHWKIRKNPDKSGAKFEIDKITITAKLRLNG